MDKSHEYQFDADKIAELETLVAQQAAVIEQMRFGLKLYYRDFKLAKELIELQPCPEVLNKVRADAVREAANFIEPNVGRIFVLDEYIRRIEQEQCE